MVLIALMLATLVGCNDYKGSLVVYSDLNFKSHRSVQFSPGTYRAAVGYSPRSGNVEFKVDGAHKVKLKGLKKYLKGDNTFAVDGDEIGENFDLNGNFATTVFNSPSHYQTISCVKGYMPVWAGRTVINEPIYGSKPVIAHNQTTTYTMTARFISPARSTLLAQFKGDSSETELVVDEELGSCN